MDIKLKKIVNGRVIRVHSGGEIKEVLINTSFLDPKKERVQLCFRGQRNSGIVELTYNEAEELYNSLKNKFTLIKDVKIIRDKK